VSAVEGMRIARCAIDVREICVARARGEEFGRRVREHGVPLPDIGHVTVHGARLMMCIRPGRYLLLAAPQPDSSAALMPGLWPPDAAPAAVIDLTGGHGAVLLQGTRRLDVLARGCRLDLDPAHFPVGRAAATIMVQVPVMLAALPAGLLLLAPASTARHVHEWLEATARPFGLVPQSSVGMAELCRSSVQ